MRYIRRVQVEAPGTHDQHIVRVQWSLTRTGPLQRATRGDIVCSIELDHLDYRAINERTGDEAAVVTRTTATGSTYITTAPDGRMSNNLLSLTRF